MFKFKNPPTLNSVPSAAKPLETRAPAWLLAGPSSESILTVTYTISSASIIKPLLFIIEFTTGWLTKSWLPLFTLISNT